MPKSTRSKSLGSSKSSSSILSTSREKTDDFDPEMSLPPVNKKKLKTRRNFRQAEIAALRHKRRRPRITDSELLDKLGEMGPIIVEEPPARVKKDKVSNTPNSSPRQNSPESKSPRRTRFLRESGGDSGIASAKTSVEMRHETLSRIRARRQSYYDRLESILSERATTEMVLVTLHEDTDGHQGPARRKRSTKTVRFTKRKICKCIPVRSVMITIMVITLLSDVWLGLIGMSMIGTTEDHYKSFGSFFFGVAICDGFLTTSGIAGALIRRGSLLIPWVVTRIFAIPIWAIYLTIVLYFRTGVGSRVAFIGFVFTATILIVVVFDVFGYLFLQELYELNDHRMSLSQQPFNIFRENECFNDEDDESKPKKNNGDEEELKNEEMLMSGETRKAEGTIHYSNPNESQKGNEKEEDLRTPIRYLYDDREGSIETIDSIYPTYKNRPFREQKQ